MNLIDYVDSRDFVDYSEVIDEEAERKEASVSNRELQLRIYREKLKRERRTQRFIATPEKPRPTLSAICAEIDRLSMGKVMCPIERYDTCKPANWPTAKEVCELAGQSWEEIGENLGLRMRATWKMKEND